MDHRSTVHPQQRRIAQDSLHRRHSTPHSLATMAQADASRTLAGHRRSLPSISAVSVPEHSYGTPPLAPRLPPKSLPGIHGQAADAEPLDPHRLLVKPSPLNFDVRCPPMLPLSFRAAFVDLAFSGQLNEYTIIFNSHHLPFHLNIIVPAGCTCFDFLYLVYHELQKPVAEAERVRAGRSAEVTKRVHLLGNAIYFRGIRGSLILFEQYGP